LTSDMLTPTACLNIMILRHTRAFKLIADRLPWTRQRRSKDPHFRKDTYKSSAPSLFFLDASNNPEKEHRWKSSAESSRPAGRSLASA
jgi:hypothetical protein